MDLALYGSWEAVDISKSMPQGVGTFSTIENFILRTFIFGLFLDPMGHGSTRMERGSTRIEGGWNAEARGFPKIEVRGMPERDTSSLGAVGLGRGGRGFRKILPSPPPPSRATAAAHCSRATAL